jgi:AmpD protein
MMRFLVAPDGWVLAARRLPSPHCDARPAGQAVSLLVVHCISLPRGVYGGPEIALLFGGQLPTGPGSAYADLAGLRVASHFLIRRDGELLQFVSCGQRAWHAGRSVWRGRSDCNDFSIGVELEGVDDGPFEPAQYAVLAALQRGLSGRYPLTAAAAHSDIAPGRKTDPGSGFEWRLAALGLPHSSG